MKIARYWERADLQVPGRDGHPFPITGWGWSESDRDEAKQRALDSVQNIAARLTSGKGFPDAYDYLERPRREEIVEEIHNDNGELIGAITRNHYGSLVLNTAQLMFIDIDLPVETSMSSFLRSIKQFFGLNAESPADQKRTEIKSAAARYPTFTFRVYRTLAGFRIAVVNKRISPGSSESAELFAAFGSDPLYVRLCTKQDSFRARLSPKHWRCGAARPLVNFPYETASARAAFEEWKRNYENGCSTFATCSFIEQLGSTPSTNDHARLIRLHDSLSRAESGLSLA